MMDDALMAQPGQKTGCSAFPIRTPSCGVAIGYVKASSLAKATFLIFR
jgi:hypothetical protein